jgi:PIF1 helicase.
MIKKAIYDLFILAVSAEQGGLFFLDSPGGPCKIYPIPIILAQIQSNNGIAFAVATSSIAATLMAGGRTTHLAFKLPLNIQNNPDSVCNIKN